MDGRMWIAGVLLCSNVFYADVRERRHCDKFIEGLNIGDYFTQGLKAKLLDNKPLGGGTFGTVFPAEIELKNGIKKNIILKYISHDLDETLLPDQKKERQEIREKIQKNELEKSQDLIAKAKANIAKTNYNPQLKRDGNLLGHQQGLESIVLVKGSACSSPKEGKKELVLIQDQIVGETMLDACFEDGARCPANLQLSILQAAGFWLGVVALHEQGFVHRDIKPENLMKGCNNGIRTIKIIDLGAVDSIIKPQFIGRDIICGSTPAFFPPEIEREDRPYSEIIHYTPQQEMYAVGLTLIPLLFGTVSKKLYLYAIGKPNKTGNPNEFSDAKLIEEFYYKPHKDLQKFMRDQFSLINIKREEALEDPTLVGKVPQEVIDQLGNLVADCLMMRPGCILASDRNQDIGPYKDKYGRTLRRPTAEEALQVLQNLALSNWETGNFEIQREE